MPINEPTLTIVDLANGGGGVATVSGSTVGSTNTLYGAKYDPAFTVRPWISLGSRVSDGTIAFTRPLGHWAFVVKSTLAAESEVSLPRYGGITDATRESVLLQCLNAVAERIKAIGLHQLSHQSVVVSELPWTRLYEGESPRLPLPGIMVCPVGSERFTPKTSTRDDIDYPCLVSIVARNNNELGQYLERYTLWRELIHTAFRAGRLPGVQKVHTVSTEPGTIVVPEPFTRLIWHSALVVRCTARQGRGLGVA